MTKTMNNKTLRRLSAGTLSLLLALALGIVPLSGCGGSGSADEPAEETPAETTDDATADAEADAVDEIAIEPVWVQTGYTYYYESSDGFTSDATCTYELDEHGNTIKSINADPASDWTYVTVYEHDEDGFLTAMSMEEDGTGLEYYTLEKDDAGRVVKRTSEDGTTVTWTYENGVLVKKTMEGMTETLDEDWNPTGEMESYTYTFVYDDQGYIQSLTSLQGETKSETTYTFEYNDDGTAASMTESLVSYDADGNVLEDESSEETYRYEYDENGNLIRSVGTMFGGTATYEYTYAYIEDPSLSVWLGSRLFKY